MSILVNLSWLGHGSSHNHHKVWIWTDIFHLVMPVVNLTQLKRYIDIFLPLMVAKFAKEKREDGLDGGAT